MLLCDYPAETHRTNAAMTSPSISLTGRPEGQHFIAFNIVSAFSYAFILESISGPLEVDQVCEIVLEGRCGRYSTSLTLGLCIGDKSTAQMTIFIWIAGGLVARMKTAAGGCKHYSVIILGFLYRLRPQILLAPSAKSHWDFTQSPASNPAFLETSRLIILTSILVSYQAAVGVHILAGTASQASWGSAIEFSSTVLATTARKYHLLDSRIKTSRNLNFRNACKCWLAFYNCYLLAK